MKEQYYLSIVFLVAGLCILGSFYKETIPSGLLWVIFTCMLSFFLGSIIQFILGLTNKEGVI